MADDFLNIALTPVFPRQPRKVAFCRLPSTRAADSFASFDSLTLETKAIYDRYVGLLPDALTSPLYFQSLYAWNFASVNKYRVFGEHLCLVADDTMAKETFAFPPLGPLEYKSFAFGVRAMSCEFSREGLPLAFHEVPDFMLPYFRALDGCELDISYERDWSDYMFSMSDFTDGLQKKSSREARRSFERHFHPTPREIRASDRDSVLAVTRSSFCEKRSCEDCFCGCELEVVSRMMEGWGTLGLKGVIVESEGEAIGFEIVCFQKDTVLFISKKVRRGMRGLNEYLNAALIDGFGRGYVRVNYSDDMGSEGLRAYKSRLGRHVLSHRYVIRLLPD